MLWAQRAPLRGLSFEDPWLAAATSDGAVLLLDAESALRGGRGNDSTLHRRIPGRGKAARQRLSGPSGPAFCVDISDNALACGSGPSARATREIWHWILAMMRSKGSPEYGEGEYNL